MSTPLTVTATLKTPVMEGGVDCPFPLNFTAQYDNLVRNRLSLVGAGTQVIDFGSIPSGVKGLAVTVDPNSSVGAAPVLITLNGNPDVIELSPGGFWLYGSPVPTAAGITAMSIAHAVDTKMNIWLFG